MQRLLNPIYLRQSDCRIRGCIYLSKTISLSWASPRDILREPLSICSRQEILFFSIRLLPRARWNIRPTWDAEALSLGESRLGCWRFGPSHIFHIPALPAG